MLNTANLFIFAYTQQEEALRWLTCNCDLPGTNEALDKFHKEFRTHFSEALKVREEHILSMREVIRMQRETSPESHSEFYDTLMSNIISTIPLSFTKEEESDLPF